MMASMCCGIGVSRSLRSVPSDTLHDEQKVPSSDFHIICDASDENEIDCSPLSDFAAYTSSNIFCEFHLDFEWYKIIRLPSVKAAFGRRRLHGCAEMLKR